MTGPWVAPDYTDSASSQNFSSEDLLRRVVERRALEAVNWGIPAVNSDCMVPAMKKAGGCWNQIVIVPRLQNWKNQPLTPNPDLVYLLAFVPRCRGTRRPNMFSCRR
jgi:hypothetical protein